MKYCRTCILPDTRPNLTMDETERCDACRTSSKKVNIDWKNRESQFHQIVKQIQLKSNNYDCVIPVSGGKDSTWQVIKSLEYGLWPLCITWKTPVRTALGQANLQNLISLGVDHIDFSINPIVEKDFTLKTFEKYGSPVIPMHMALHSIPLQIAINYKIPLILWGENSANEYGGEESLKGVQLNHAWLKKYGVTNGTTAEDWVDDDLSKRDLTPYVWPSDQQQKKADVTAVFLGHYFNWDPVQTYNISKAHGFKADSKPKTGYYEFADIDDSFLITIHHWMKWYKFGFTRLWDNLSIEIRNKRMKRKKAIELIRTAGEEIPVREIKDFCTYLQITENRFFEIASSFRDKKIWKKNNKGYWFLENFLIDDWEWK